MKHLQVFVLTLIVLTIFVNCSPKIVPVTDVRVDSVYIAQYQRDTIYERDSVLVYTLADTIYKEKYRYVYRDRFVTDTLWRERGDTINTIVEVEKRLSRIEEWQMDIGRGVMWAVPIILCLYLLYRKILK
jgi:hypothetical protein